MVDAYGDVIRADPGAGSGGIEPAVSAAEFPQGGFVEELEGIFVARQGRAVFVPVKTGIAGERYFEALTGVREGDLVITGPFSEVRNLGDGEAIRVVDSAQEGTSPDGFLSGLRNMGRARFSAAGR